jgi:hypothetical protein
MLGKLFGSDRQMELSNETQLCKFLLPQVLHCQEHEDVLGTTYNAHGKVGNTYKMLGGNLEVDERKYRNAS